MRENRDDYTVTDTIVKLERMNNSRDGNPRWRVTLAAAGVHTTVPDAQVNHGIENSEYQNVPLSVTLDRHGQIVRIEIQEKTA